MGKLSHTWKLLITVAICLLVVGAAAFVLFRTIPAQSQPEQAEKPPEASETVSPDREQAYKGEIPEAVQDAQNRQELLSQESDEMKAARAYLAEMTLDEKIYQLFIVSPEQLTQTETCTELSEQDAEKLMETPVGGVIFFPQNLTDAAQTAKLISDLQSASATPLFVGLDEEGGSVSRLGGKDGFDVPKLQPMKTYGEKGDTEALRADMADLASSLSYLGFNLDFAPVCDVSADEDSPIGSRSFGSDAALCGKMVAAAVSAMQSSRISACLKHFPGYGSAKTGANAIEKSADALQKTDFVPFAAGIEADAYFVMVSHLTVPALDEQDMPANHSSKVVSELLREGLGFSNIVITDAQNADAVTKKYTVKETVLNALNAGCDMILLPQDLSEAYAAVSEAVETGKLSAERLDESVLRILYVKVKLGLIS